MSFSQIKAETLRDHVLQALRKAILDGELKSGERLVESKLADQMGVSRGPIREAVSQLKNEGLVKVIPHKGTFVVEWSDEDILEVYLLRSVLEGLAARRAVEIFSDKDFSYLQSLLNKAKNLPKDGSVSKLSSLCMNLHEYICRQCGFPRLYEMWSCIYMQRRLFSVISFIFQDRDEIILKHQTLLYDLCKRDPELAEQSMRKHIMDARMLLEIDRMRQKRLAGTQEIESGETTEAETYIS